MNYYLKLKSSTLNFATKVIADFNDINDDDLVIIIDKLNNRPRKTLGYSTPNEIFFGRNVTVRPNTLEQTVTIIQWLFG